MALKWVQHIRSQKLTEASHFENEKQISGVLNCITEKRVT